MLWFARLLTVPVTSPVTSPVRSPTKPPLPVTAPVNVDVLDTASVPPTVALPETAA